MLAETFKYLYLMYAEEEDILLPINEFIFTTEAHLIPLNISMLNISHNGGHVTHVAIPNQNDAIANENDEITDDETIEDDDTVFDEIIIPVKCGKVGTEKWTYDYYRRLMLQQCGSLRYGLSQSAHAHKEKDSGSEWTRSVTTSMLDFTNPLHIAELSEMGISVKSLGSGQIQLFQSPQNVRLSVCLSAVCARVCVCLCLYICVPA